MKGEPQEHWKGAHCLGELERLYKGGEASPRSLRRPVLVKNRKGCLASSVCVKSELWKGHGVFGKWSEFQCDWEAFVSGEVRTYMGGWNRAVMALPP